MYTCKNPRDVIPYGLLNSKHIRCCHTRRLFIIGICEINLKTGISFNRIVNQCIEYALERYEEVPEDNAE